MVNGTAVGLRKLKMQWRRHGEGGAGPMVSTRHGGGGGWWLPPVTATIGSGACGPRLRGVAVLGAMGLA
jgi:hypothetical protein